MLSKAQNLLKKALNLFCRKKSNIFENVVTVDLEAILLHISLKSRDRDFDNFLLSNTKAYPGQEDLNLPLR